MCRLRTTARLIRLRRGLIGLFCFLRSFLLRCSHSGSFPNLIGISPFTPLLSRGHLYLCIWVRKIEPRSSSLYWAIASLVTGVGFLFSWLLWFVVIFELREELLDHYNRREPINLRLNWFLTFLFSFVYFQFALNKITREKERAARVLRTRIGGLRNCLTPPLRLCFTAINAMHNFSLNAIACHAIIFSAPSAVALHPRHSN